MCSTTSLQGNLDFDSDPSMGLSAYRQSPPCLPQPLLARCAPAVHPVRTPRPMP